MRARSRMNVVMFSSLALFGVIVGVVIGATTKSAPTVKIAQNSKLGTILVSSTGFTLYQLGSEKKGTIKCTGSCAKIWPPLLLAAGAKPVAGTGVSQATLGTIKRPDHGTQITYNGNALYGFASDRKPGVVKGQNVADFHVIVVKASSAGSPTPAATTTTSGGYGYG
jgi:predicted lipoprotein with Yx(FWY)xxD motif